MADPAASDTDPWRARLSDVLDGDLSADERAEADAHLARCADCARLLGDLRTLVRAARALPTPVPERDLWPGIAALLAPGRTRSLPRWSLFAAGVLVAAVLFLVLDRARAVPVELARHDGAGYLLLLHEPAGFDGGVDAAQHAAIVERYARWAAELGARCLGGEELEQGGLELRPGAGVALASELAPWDRVGGFFLLQARDPEEARALAETCPHLAQGGWIELRRIRTTPPGADGQR